MRRAIQFGQPFTVLTLWLQRRLNGWRGDWVVVLVGVVSNDVRCDGSPQPPPHELLSTSPRRGGGGRAWYWERAGLRRSTILTGTMSSLSEIARALFPQFGFCAALPSLCHEAA